MDFQKDSYKSRPGRGPRIEKEFDAQLIDLARVTRVAAGGRRFRFRAVVISGNKKGKVGVGVAKGADVAQAIEKASKAAEKRLITVPFNKGTIPHEVRAKFGASRVLLRPQVEGRGLVAGSSARIICEKAGIQNVSAKFTSKTHNKLNNAMATISALKKLKAVKPEEQKQEYATTSTETDNKEKD
jgi:small subunit ribosomal protein S5